MFHQQSILFYAISAGFFASIIAGMMGTLISLKNLSPISGGISHAILGGIGMAYFFGFSEYVGAIIFALGSAMIISWVHFYLNENENVIIGALWSVGMAIGIVFMHLAPGYGVDLTNYIFGSIVLLSLSDVYLIAILSLMIGIFIFIFYRQFIALSFDTEHAQLRGLYVKFIYTLLLSLISLSVVILLKITGLILLIALFTLPSAIGKMWFSRIFSIMVIASLLCFLAVFLGFFSSFLLELPTGAMIVLILGVFYFISLVLKILSKS